MSEIDEKLELCPQCNTDLRPYQTVGSLPSFCLQCRFPLMTIAGKYRLLEVVGQGAVGTVYLARHLKLRHNADRVVKVIKEEMLKTHTTVQRFLREVQVTAELSERNDHIVRIYDDFGELPRLGYFYVMEFIRGESVRKYIQSQTHLPSIAWCVDVMGQLSDALHTAHSAGVVHRDLKPDNMMLTQKGTHPHYLKVLDWGIAKPLVEEKDAHLTQGLVGTPHYMAPEQALNQQIDARCDIYAMAVILYELLTGVNPFVAATGKKGRTHDSMVDLINAQLHQTPPKFLEVLPQRQDISPALEGVIFKALSKNPEHRFSSVLQFWEALQEATGMGSTTPTSHVTGSFKGAEATPSNAPLIPTGQITGNHPGHSSASVRVDSSGIPSPFREKSDPNSPPPLSPRDSWQETVVHTSHVPTKAPIRRGQWLLVGCLLFLILGLVGWGWYQSRSRRHSSAGLGKTPIPQHRVTTLNPPPRTTTQPPQRQQDAVITQPVAVRTNPIPSESSERNTPRQTLINPGTSKNTKSSDDSDDSENSDDSDDSDDARKTKAHTKPRIRHTKPRIRHTKPRVRHTTQQTSPTPTRVEPAARPTHPCGTGNWILVEVRPFLGQSSEVTAEGGQWKRLSSRRFCISTSTRLLSIVQEGYALCAFSVPQRPSLRIRLWEAGSGGLSASSCLRP